MGQLQEVSKLFRAYGLYNKKDMIVGDNIEKFQSSFELTGYITKSGIHKGINPLCFKALSSLRVI